MTIVAAWISADTGVGPAIASPSQDCSGNCADLPQAAEQQQQPDRGRARASLAPSAAAKTPVKLDASRTCANMIMIASDSPMSPTRLTTNAFLAAVA